jgi:hypothetical protein
MNFELSHSVDDSDVAFVMRLDRRSTVCSMLNSSSTKLHKVGTNIDGFINLATLNYLLAGLQLCYVSSHTEKSKWFELLYDLDQYMYPTIGTQLTLWDLRYITRELIVPFGVVRGSEKQGGQDETSLSAATWPVNFVCNMVLDGHERNILNYWHYHDINAGEDLVFRLKPMPIPKGKSAYTLNHYYKRFVQHNFESYFQLNLGHAHASHVWQLVPDVFSMEYKPENDHYHGNQSILLPPGFEVPQDYVWQEQGYWHIARSQVMVRKYAVKEYYNDDMANQLKVSHLDVTFEPTYCKAPGESRDPASHRTVLKETRPRDMRVPVRTIHKAAWDRTSVAPGMMSGANPNQWTPQLRLESLLGGPMPVLDEQGHDQGLQAGHSVLSIGSDIMAACDMGVSIANRDIGTAIVRKPDIDFQRMDGSLLASTPSTSVRFASEPEVSYFSQEAAGSADVESLDYGLSFSDQDPGYGMENLSVPASSVETSAENLSVPGASVETSAENLSVPGASVEISNAPHLVSMSSAVDPESTPPIKTSSAVKSISSILSGMGGGRGKKRKPQDEPPGSGGDSV